MVSVGATDQRDRGGDLTSILGCAEGVPVEGKAKIDISVNVYAGESNINIPGRVRRPMTAWKNRDRSCSPSSETGS